MNGMSNKYLLYFVPLYLILFLTFFNSKKVEKIMKIVLFPIFLLLGFQIAIGTDFYSYIRIFNGEEIIKYSRGPVFKVLIDFLKKNIGNERSMFLVIGFIQVVLLYKIVMKLYEQKIVTNIALYISVFIISTSMYLSCFNILRNSIASLFVELGVLYILSNKKKTSFILILLGVGFHPSVIIWQMLLPLRKFILKKRKNIIIFLLLIGAFILNKIGFIPNLARYIYNLNIDIPYRKYLISKHMFPYTEHFGIGTIITIGLYIFSLAFYKKEKDEKKIFMFNLGYIFYILSVLFSDIPIFERMLGPKDIGIAYLNYTLLNETLTRKYYYVGVLILLYYVLSFFMAMHYMLPPI